MRGTECTAGQMEHARKFLMDRAPNVLDRPTDERRVTIPFGDIARILAWYGALRFIAGRDATGGSLEIPGPMEKRDAPNEMKRKPLPSDTRPETDMREYSAEEIKAAEQAVAALTEQQAKSISVRCMDTLAIDLQCDLTRCRELLKDAVPLMSGLWDQQAMPDDRLDRAVQMWLDVVKVEVL